MVKGPEDDALASIQGEGVNVSGLLNPAQPEPLLSNYTYRTELGR